MLQHASCCCGAGGPSAFHVRSEGKLLDFNTAGASRESWGQTPSTAEVAAHSHRGSGSYSADFFSGSLCEPTLRPVVMLGPCLVVHLCLIQLQGGT